MLLRRVIEHVKTQNWTAVALDFVIVVVGVFIGIQAANWNESRVDRDRERIVLLGLRGEIENNVQEAAASIRFAEDMQSTIRELLGRAAGEQSTEEPLETLISDLFYWNISLMQTGVLNNVLDGDDLSLIGDVELRRRLLSIPERFEQLEAYQAWDGDTVKLRLHPLLLRSGYIPQLLNEFRGLPGSREKLDYDLRLPLQDELRLDHSAVLHNREFSGILALRYANMADAQLLSDLQSELEETMEMIDRRLEELGGS